MISLEKLKILTPWQKLPKTVGDLGKLIVAKGFKKFNKSPNLVTLLLDKVAIPPPPTSEVPQRKDFRRIVLFTKFKLFIFYWGHSYSAKTPPTLKYFREIFELLRREIFLYGHRIASDDLFFIYSSPKLFCKQKRLGRQQAYPKLYICEYHRIAHSAFQQRQAPSLNVITVLKRSNWS